MIDMFPIRFLQEVNRLPEFVTQGRKIASVMKHGIPAWKAPFIEAVAASHSSYTLPSFEMFKDATIKSLIENNRNDASHYKDTFAEHHFPKLFDKDTCEPNAGFLYRLSELYEGGIAELYCYCMLVMAFEDCMGNGIVLNDMRVDWKLKLDALVMCNGKTAGIDMHYDSGVARSNIEGTRRVREMASKRHIPVRDWDNDTVTSIPKFVITRSASDNFLVNGFRLYSNEAIDGLLTELYDYFEVDPDARVSHRVLHKYPQRG